MKMVTPQALPEGESSSTGIIVSATAEKKAASAAVNVSSASSFAACGALPSTGLGCWASAFAAGVSPAATAVPAPNRKLRRAIDAVSSVVWSSAIDTSLGRRPWARHTAQPASFVVWNKTKPVCATAGRGSIPFAAWAGRATSTEAVRVFAERSRPWDPYRLAEQAYAGTSGPVLLTYFVVIACADQ